MKKPAKAQLPLEQVLDHLTAEFNWERPTLDRYLKDHPEYASDLQDLWTELTQPSPSKKTTLTSRQKELIEAACKKHPRFASAVATDPFAVLTTQRLRDLASSLEVPRQVLTAFRERKVLVESVPRRFLASLASELSIQINEFVVFLKGVPSTIPARSYKAEGKPSIEQKVTFERILTDAQVPAEKRAKLLSEND
jgi:hypothetical protein